MKKALLLIWRKSPIKILLVLAALLTALGHFENTARNLRNQDIIIQIKGDKSLNIPLNDVNGGDEEYSPDNHSATIAEWYKRMEAEPVDQLRADWEAYKQELNQALSGEYFYFEIRLLMADERWAEALTMLNDSNITEENAGAYYLNKAIIENRLGMRAKAIASYQELISFSQNSYPAHYNLGSLYYSLNRYTLAKAYLERAVEFAGGIKRAKALRALGRTMIKLENYEMAEEVLQESILLEPPTIASRLVLAELYTVYLNDKLKARETYETISRLNRDVPELYLGLADLELAEGDWEQALEILEDARLQVSDNLPVILKTARILLDNGTVEQVRNLLDVNGQIFPEEPAIDFLNGRMYYRLGDLNKSASSFTEAIDKSTGPYPEAVNNLGLVYIAQEKWAMAEQQYLKAVEMNPWYETAWYNLGIVYLNLEQWADSERCFKQAIGIDPEYQAALYNLGIVYSAIGQLAEAINAYEESLLLQPEDTKARLNLAVLYRRIGDDAKASEQYQLVLEINPAYASAWFNLGLLNKMQGNLEVAEDAYREAVELEPDNELYWMNLSSLLGSQNRISEAVEILSEALEIHVNSPALRYNLALQFKKSGQTEKALEEILVSLRLSPEFAKGWRTAGSLYSDLGDHRAAAESFRKSIEIDDSEKYTFYLLGKEEYAIGRADAAVSAFETALSEIKDNAFLWYNAGRAFALIGRTAKASEYYSIALDINSGIVRNIADDIELIDETGSIYYSRIEQEPGVSEWPIQLAKLLMRSENTDEAETVLLDARLKFPGNITILTLLAEIYETQDGFESAEKYLIEAVESDPFDTDLYYRLGKLLERSGNTESAESYLREGLILDPEHVSILRTLGETLYDQKKYSGTIDVLKQAVELEPSAGLSHITLGKAYYREKLYAEAELSFRNGKIYEADYVWSYIWLGRALRKLERYDEAEAEFTQAVELESGHLQAWLALGDLYREQVLDDKALDAYTEALKIDPSSTSVRGRIDSVSE